MPNCNAATVNIYKLFVNQKYYSTDNNFKLKLLSSEYIFIYDPSEGVKV